MNPEETRNYFERFLNKPSIIRAENLASMSLLERFLHWGLQTETWREYYYFKKFQMAGKRVISYNSRLEMDERDSQFIGAICAEGFSLAFGNLEPDPGFVPAGGELISTGERGYYQLICYWLR